MGAEGGYGTVTVYNLATFQHLTEGFYGVLVNPNAKGWDYYTGDYREFFVPNLLAFGYGTDCHIYDPFAELDRLTTCILSYKNIWNDNTSGGDEPVTKYTLNEVLEAIQTHPAWMGSFKDTERIYGSSFWFLEFQELMGSHIEFLIRRDLKFPEYYGDMTLFDWACGIVYCVDFSSVNTWETWT